MNTYPVKILNIGIVAFVAGLLLIPFGGQVPLFDWDEINFAESAREMIVSGDYFKVTVNFEPFWEKPPLFIWLQVLSMKVFGINEFAARFPNALTGIFTISMIFYIGTRYFRGYIGEGWVYAYGGAIFPHFYFNTGLIDPLFNLFVFLGIFQIYLGIKEQHNRKRYVLAGLFTGLAILTKGPVALLISILVGVVFSIVKKKVFYIPLQRWGLYLFISLLVSSIWFLPEIIKNGPWFLKEFIAYQMSLASENVAGHAQPFYYHTLVLLLGCFPISILAFSLFQKNSMYEKQEYDFIRLMAVLFFVVLVVFSVVKTKIIHYSSLCWLPLTFFGGLAYDGYFRNKFSIKNWQKLFLLLLALIWGLIFISLPLLGMHEGLRNLIISKINDPFVIGNISVNAGWSWTEMIPVVFWIIGAAYAFYFLFKNQYFKFQKVLLLTQIIFIPLFAIMIVPKAEKHIQGTIIDFYKEIAGKDVYVKATEKSYAPYFYAQVSPLDEGSTYYLEQQKYLQSIGKKDVRLSAKEKNELERHMLNVLLYHQIDKDAYFVSKVQKANHLIENPELELIIDAGGYMIFKRAFKKYD
jgi:hypothetical protein